MGDGFSGQVSTVAAKGPLTVAKMSAYRYEAIEACAADPAIFARASRGAGYFRWDHGLVGIGVRNQRVAATGPQVSGGLGSRRLSGKAERGRRTRLLPCGLGAIETAGETSKIYSEIGV